MQLHFDNAVVDIILNSNPITSAVQKMYRHLQHLPINFKPWDSYYYSDIPQDQLVAELVKFGKKLNLDVDTQECINYNQEYFNSIHKIYEQNYNGNPEWLDFHEHIHLCEYQTKRLNALVIDYREKAGLLKKSFDQNWMKNTTTVVSCGDVYVSWAELGKTPYTYWKNSEPNDLDRICQLCKPWLTLRPKLFIALEDIDFTVDFDVVGFNKWWQNYKEDWCQHWGIDHWGLTEMAAVGVIGSIVNPDLVKSNLQKQIFPKRISV